MGLDPIAKNLYKNRKGSYNPIKTYDFAPPTPIGCGFNRVLQCFPTRYSGMFREG